MKRVALLSLLGLAACVEGGLPALTSGGNSVSTSSAYTEYLVLGGARMTFEQCKAQRGLVIHDQGSPMWACDPRVTVNAPIDDTNEFNHPANPAGTASDT